MLARFLFATSPSALPQFFSLPRFSVCNVLTAAEPLVASLGHVIAGSG
jgi:hypothetical protein